MATTGQKLLAAGPTVVIAETVLGMAHFGGIGAIVGLALGAAAYVAVDEVERMTGRDEKSLPDDDPQQSERAMEQQQQKGDTSTEKQHSLAYRLFNGKSTREVTPIHQDDQILAKKQDIPTSKNRADGDDELAVYNPTGRRLSTFSETLRTFTPSLDHIYLASVNGKPVYCEAEDLCHVALAGATGGGKSSIMRLLMSQLCASGATVLLLNPHYTRYDLARKEDWTPFIPYLVQDPMKCREYVAIEYYLKQVATVLLPTRLDRYAHSLPLGRPYFIVLDELPAIIKNIEGAADYIEKILREGRKLGIYLITAATDFLVKTISPQGGGAIRECYRTAYYVGGDTTTARVLLDLSINQIAEEEMGKGQVMLRNIVMKKAARASVPYVDNDALYQLLGPSTYVPAAVKGVDDLSLENLSPSDDEEEEEFEDDEEELSEREVQYQRALDAWAKGAKSIRKMSIAMGVNFNEARVLLNEMNELGIVTWVNKEDQVTV